MVIFSKVKIGVTPDINALATIVISVVAAGVITAGWIMLRQERQLARDRQLGARG
jgi:putrescine transport system permease protein